MNKGKVKWVFLALVVLLGLALIVKPLPRQKARAQRIQTVNNTWTATFTLPTTNAPPAASSKK
jgi:hypothetical protein